MTLIDESAMTSLKLIYFILLCFLLNEAMLQSLRDMELIANDIIKPTSSSKKFHGANRFQLMRPHIKTWPNATIPYSIDYNFTDARIVSNVYKVIAELHNKTCLKFVPRTSESEYLSIKGEPGTGCSALVGFVGIGAQSLNLEDGQCTSKYVAAHELMHAIGFGHEQQRPDRDKYVDILWDIIPEDAKQFVEKDPVDQYPPIYSTFPYDMCATTHYAMTFNYRKSILPKSNVENLIKCPENKPFVEHELRLSDVLKINTLYRCQGYPQLGNQDANFRNQKTKCKNEDLFCDKWAKLGHCVNLQYQEYMHNFCQKSCSTCTSQ